MTERIFHDYLVLTVFALSVPVFIALLRITAPYGRHLRSGWGPTIPARVGWIVMESPSVILFAAVFYIGDYSRSTVPLILFGLWQFHYINRTFIFPFRLKGGDKRMPLAIAGMAILFNCINSYINARWISHFGDYPDTWLATLPFALGILCFFTGWVVNQHADTILIRLRKANKNVYGIPHGGLYRWVSCPNYLGEMLEWAGWALAAWSLAGWAFAVFTAANLLPRALANHRWYRDQFPDYPNSRRALIPYML